VPYLWDADSNANSDRTSKPDAYRYRYIDDHAQCHTNCHSNPNSNGDRHSHGYGYSYNHSQCYPDSYGYAHTDVDSQTNAD
jgi:hypothetical protein